MLEQNFGLFPWKRPKCFVSYKGGQRNIIPMFSPKHSETQANVNNEIVSTRITNIQHRSF